MAMAGIVSDAENRLSRRQIAWLVANEIPDGAYVNLGIGIPTLCADHMPSEKEILFIVRMVFLDLDHGLRKEMKIVI